MKIFITGDIHANSYQFDYLLGIQDEYDVLCLTGDLLYGHIHQNIVKQTELACDFLARCNKPTLLCSGNHDFDESFEAAINAVASSSDAIYIDNQVISINEVKFGIMPYIAPEYFEFMDCDILLTHVPPKHTKTAQENKNNQLDDWGDVDLFCMLDKKVLTPEYLFCGHVENPVAHTDSIHKTKIINPGNKHTNKVPAIYKLDI